jgi:hypothetical protein
MSKRKHDIVVFDKRVEWFIADLDENGINRGGSILRMSLKDFMMVANMIRPYFTGEEYGGGTLRLSWYSDE